MRVQSIEINLVPASRAEAARIFSGLKSGDTVQAELAAVNGSRILLKTQDEKTIQADFRGNIQFQPGDMLDLALDSRQRGTISLRLLALNGQPLRLDVNAQENLLLRSGIEPTALNVRLSGILQKNGFLPTAQNISNLTRITQDQPKLPADLSAFLAANNLKPDAETLRQLNQLLTQAPQTGTRVQQLSNAFTQLLASFEAASGQGTSENTTADTILQSASQSKPFTASGLAVAQRLSGDGADARTSEGLEQLYRALASLSGQDGFKGIKDQLAGHTKAASSAAGPGTGSLTEIFRLLASMPEQDAKAALSSLAGKDSQNVKVYTALLSFLNLPAHERLSVLNLPAESPERITGASNPPQEGLSSNLSVQEKNKVSANSGIQIQTENSAETLPNMAQPGPDRSALDASGHLLRKLDELFLHLNPNDIPSSAEEMRKSILNQEKLMESVRADLTHLTGDKSSLTRQAVELHAQVQFTSSLEHFFYFQIPVRFENQKSTAELYIFERNSKTKNNRELSTVLIALETQNLGRIETMLQCVGNILDVNFRLNSESFSNYLKDKASELRQALGESGFQVKSIQFGLIETKTTVLNAQELLAKESRIPAAGLDIQI